MTTQTADTIQTLTDDMVPSPAAKRAVNWIRISVVLTIVNAVLLFFGSTLNFIFGMTWSYPLEDLAYNAGNAFGGLVLAIALALPMLWVANRARTQPRLMLAIAAAVYLIGSVVAIAAYSDFIGMAGQLVIFGLAVLGAKNPVTKQQEPAELGWHDDLSAPHTAPHATSYAAPHANPVAFAQAPAGSPTAPQTVPGSGGVAVLDAP